MTIFVNSGNNGTVLSKKEKMPQIFRSYTCRCYVPRQNFPVHHDVLQLSFILNSSGSRGKTSLLPVFRNSGWPHITSSIIDERNCGADFRANLGRIPPESVTVSFKHHFLSLARAKLRCLWKTPTIFFLCRKEVRVDALPPKMLCNIPKMLQTTMRQNGVSPIPL